MYAYGIGIDAAVTERYGRPIRKGAYTVQYRQYNNAIYIAYLKTECMIIALYLRTWNDSVE